MIYESKKFSLEVSRMRFPCVVSLSAAVRTLTIFILALTAFLHATPAEAATSVDILDRQRDQIRDAPKSRPQIQIQEDGQIPQEQGVPRFVLNSLHLAGSTAFKAEELLAPYGKLAGSSVSLNQIQGIAAELTKKYRDAGYVLSRVIVPAQEVDEYGANIRLVVVEGFIEGIQYAGDDRVLERFKNYFASGEKKLLAQKPLKHSDFEHLLLLMQDVPGVRVTSRFERGTLPGGAVLHIEVQGDIVEGNVSWGNTGTEASGPGIGSITLGLNTLPVIGNRATVTYSQANDYREYWSVKVADRYQFWNGLALTASYAYSDSPRMDTDFAKLFDYTNNSTTWKFGISYPLIRSRDLNLSAGINYENRNSDSFIEDEHFTKDRLRTLSANVNFDLADSWNGVTQIIATIYRGLNVFDASDKSQSASNSVSPAEYWKFDLYLTRNQQLPNNFSIYTAAEIQLSDQTLASYNKFSFGGTQFGRGYEPGNIEGDNGFAFTLEPRWSYNPTDKTGLQMFAFLDYGTVWTNKSVWGTPDKQYGVSAGLGVRLWGHVGHDNLPDFNITAYLGQPLKDCGKDDARHPRFVLQATLFF